MPKKIVVDLTQDDYARPVRPTFAPAVDEDQGPRKIGYPDLPFPYNLDGDRQPVPGGGKSPYAAE